MGQRTYVDSSVLIAAWRGRPDVARKALQILDDPRRQIVLSEAVRLEVLPKPVHGKRAEEIHALEEVFASAEVLNWAVRVLKGAYDLACAYGLAAMDAIHLSFAVDAAVDEFVTGEKPTKPLFRFNPRPAGPRVISLHDG